MYIQEKMGFLPNLMGSGRFFPSSGHRSSSNPNNATLQWLDSAVAADQKPALHTGVATPSAW